MSRDQINKLKKGGYNASSHPYSTLPGDGKPKPEKVPEIPVSQSQQTKSMNEVGKMLMLQREIDSLKMDIVSLLQIILEEDGKMTTGAMRAKYSAFRASELHVLNRLTNKQEAITNSDINFNGETNI